MNDGHGSMTVHFGAGTWFTCHTYPDESPTGPILSISTPGLSLTLSNRASGSPEAGDVENAHRLLEVVTEFVAEVERRHALTGGSGQDAGERAA